MENRSSPQNIEDRSQMTRLDYITQGEPQKQGGSKGAPALALEQAEHFLHTLDPEPNAKFVFQTFDDGPGKDRGLTKTLYGSFDQLKAELANLNRRGAGIFVTVNRSNGGRKAKNITGVRALFADFDHGVPSLDHAPLKPRMRVRSSQDKEHWYWVVDDLGADEFKALQLSIVARLGSDPAVKDLPRVMRLPGFRHMKDPDHPQLVKLIEANGHRYSAEEVRDKLTWKGDVREALKAWEKIRKSCLTVEKTQEGSRNDTLNKEAFLRFMDAIRLGLDEEIVWERLSDAARECGLGDREIKGTLDSALKTARDKAKPGHPLDGKHIGCYRVIDGRLYRTVEKGNTEQTVAISNFAAHITKEVKRTDGMETRVLFEIEG